MTIVEALKKFYKGNAYNEQELKEADSVLDAIRAKYGPYEGANVAEYLQTAMANGVTPGSGGGDSDIKSANITVSLADDTTDTLYCPVDAMDAETYMVPSFFVYNNGHFTTGWSFLGVTTTPQTVKFCWVVSNSPDFPSNIVWFGKEYNDVTVIGDAEYSDGIFTINGDCTIVVRNKIM